MTQTTPQRHNLFISYRYDDQPGLERLHVHLKPLERAGRIDRGDDTRITPRHSGREKMRQSATWIAF